MFTIHTHTQRSVCKTCQTTSRNNLPNGILCYITVSKYQDTNGSVSTVTFKIFKNSLTFVINDLSSDVLYMNKLKEKEAEPIPIDIASLNSNQQHKPPSESGNGKKPIAFENRKNECYSNAIVSRKVFNAYL